MVQNWEAQENQSRSTNVGGGMKGKGRDGGAGLGGRKFDMVTDRLSNLLFILAY